MIDFYDETHSKARHIYNSLVDVYSVLLRTFGRVRGSYLSVQRRYLFLGSSGKVRKVLKTCGVSRRCPESKRVCHTCVLNPSVSGFSLKVKTVDG